MQRRRIQIAAGAFALALLAGGAAAFATESPEGRLKNYGLTELFSESSEPPFDVLEVQAIEAGGNQTPTTTAFRVK